jgi:hypothetical protein
VASIAFVEIAGLFFNAIYCIKEAAILEEKCILLSKPEKYLARAAEEAKALFRSYTTS